jgi:hypothetical protein
MIYTSQIQKAIHLAITTHQVNQDQKRKGKDVPYIVHPLAVGLILARAGADELTIIAGILHDTIEDSVPGKKVTAEIITHSFGAKAAELVESVTEPNKKLPWDVRKQEALARIKTFNHESLLIKSADIINNVTDMFDDYKQNGEAAFEHFNAPKEKVVSHYLAVARALIGRWAENPLVKDLLAVEVELYRMQALEEGPLSYLEWNVYFIAYEMDQAYASSSVAEKVIDICKRTQGDINAFRRNNDMSAFQQSFTADMKEFDGVIKSIAGQVGEEMVCLLLQAHIADSLNSFDGFLGGSASLLASMNVAYVECDNCGFAVAFEHPNRTLYYCSTHKFGVNVSSEQMKTPQMCRPCDKPLLRHDLYE